MYLNLDKGRETHKQKDEIESWQRNCEKSIKSEKDRDFVF